ncbi:MAG: nucleotidyl transferase AbiEii/AbiGii toxin family protein [archaeon]
MYERYETDTSQRYLKEVFDVLDEPICLMGGWAVRYLVNERFKSARGREYLGSRDIDLGFRIKKGWSFQELENSAFAKAMNVLERELGFEMQGFRLLKQIHTETGKELSGEEAKATMLPFIFDLYVDLMVSEIHPDFSKAFGFVPADEPLLEKVFSGPAGRIEHGMFGKTVYLPSVEVLLAMKLNAVINRDREHKQIKDLYDIVALSLYSPRPMDKEKLRRLYSPDAESGAKLDSILDEKCTDELWKDLFGIKGETAKKTVLKMLE